MAAFCLTKQAVDNFKKGLKSGEINPLKLSEMESSARRDFLEKYVGKENAKEVNALFESKILLKNQKAGYIKWAEKVADLTPQKRKDLFSKIEKLDKVLSPQEEALFLKDLASTKLGADININEAKRITDISKDLSELSKTKGEYGLPTREYMVKLKELSDYIEEITPEIGRSRAMTIASEIAGLPRALMTTADFSAPLRQGVFLIGSRPKTFGKAFVKQFQTAFSEDAFKKAQVEIQTDPMYSLVKDSKLALTDLGEKLSKREEAFTSTWIEKIPILGEIPRGSARAYTTFLNKLRFDTFKSMVKEAQIIGRDPTKNPELLKNIANFINTATGRGRLGKLEPATNTLAQGLFSPRLIASRISLLNPAYYAKLDPFVRKEALKSLFAFTALGLGVLGLAKMNGAEVESDPRSSDFGKIKVGRTRIDIWGGFQQYIRLAAQFITNQKKSTTTGEIKDLNEGFNAESRYGTLTKFAESKAAPIPSFILDWLKNENFEGDKFDLTDEAVSRMAPILAKDIYDLYKQNDLESIPYQAASLFGVGVQTYDKNAKPDNWNNSDSKEIKAFKKEVDKEQFKEANDKFNQEYNNWYQEINKNDDFKSLSADDQKEVQDRKKDNLKKEIFIEYNFEYKPEKRSQEKLDLIESLAN